MALINITIINQDEALTAKLDAIIQKLNTIMPTLAQLSAKVDELQVALDSEQAQVATSIENLTATVNELRALIVDGGTEAERQAVADKLDAVITDLKSTIADTPPVEPPVEE